MFTSIKTTIEKFIFKQILNRVGGQVLPIVYKKTEGWRTYALLGIWGAVKIAVLMNWLPAEQAAEILKYIDLLLPAAGVTFLSKYNKLNEQFKLEEMAETLRKEALEQLGKDGVVKP